MRSARGAHAVDELFTLPRVRCPIPEVFAPVLAKFSQIMPQSQFPNARGTRINGADKENGRAGETGTPCQRARRNCGARCKLQSHAGKIPARARGVFSAHLARHSSSRAATILVRIGNGICDKPTPQDGVRIRSEATAEVKRNERRGGFDSGGGRAAAPVPSSGGTLDEGEEPF